MLSDVKFMNKEMLKSLDKENKDFYDEFYEGVVRGDTPVKKILGFTMPKAKVYVPDSCPECAHGTVSLFGLLPLYDVAIFPVYPYLRGKS